MKYETRILTEEDLELNPELYDAGLGVGDEIQYVPYSNVESVTLDLPEGAVTLPQTFTVVIDGEKYILTHADIANTVSEVYGEDTEMDL